MASSTATPGDNADMNIPEHSTSTSDKPLEVGRTTGNSGDDRASGQESLHDGSNDSPAVETEGEAKPVDAAGPPKRSGIKITLIMFSLCMAVFLAALDVTIITTALPTISEHFHSTSGYTWIGSAFLLANAASVPAWGKLSDIWGRKPVLLTANFVFLVGSLLAAVSVSIGMLIAARAIQGIGGGGLVVLVNIIIGDIFSERERGAFYGIIGGVWALASSLGPIAGGVFSEKVSWRWCFYINLPLDGMAFVIILLLLDVKTPKTPLVAGLKAIDWLGSLLVVGGTLMLLFGLQYGGQTAPWDSPLVLCLIIFGIVTLVVFFTVEWKLAKYPVMPLHLFARRSSLAAFGVCFWHGVVFIGVTYYIPLYFQASRGASPILSGVYALALAVSISLGSASTGIVIRKTGRYLPPILIGLSLMMLGVGLLINLDSTSSWAKVILFQAVAGLGIGPNFQAPLIALQASVNRRDVGTATATFGFVRQLATSISVVVGDVVFQNQMQKQAGTLIAALGPQKAKLLSGGNGAANVAFVHHLPTVQRQVAEKAFATALMPLWIMYCVAAFMGLLTGLLIGQKILSKEHEETKTGLEGEEERRVAELERRRAKRESHVGAGGLDGKDLEKAAEPKA